MEANLITLFLLLIAHRSAAGVRNGAMYNPKSDELGVPYIAGLFIVLVAAILVAIGIRLTPWGFFPQPWGAIAMGIAFPLSALAGYFALKYNDPKVTKWERDLHLWTTAEQALIYGAVSVLSPWACAMAVLSVYPAVFAQKAIINRFIDREWNYNGTDDPTGKYYGLPSLGIRIPRTTQKTRLWLCIASVVLFFIIILTYENLPHIRRY